LTGSTCEKNQLRATTNPLVCYFCPTFLATTTSQDIMENIQNSRGKGYCILYIFMGLFFLTALLLMLYNRSGVLDFAK
jgi:hypothetical protein